MKTNPILSLILLGTLIAAPELQASFSTPYVTKGQELINNLIPICKVLCGLGLVWALIDALMAKLGDRPMNWGKFIAILVVSVSLGSLSMIGQFFGLTTDLGR